jgi:hypothetical protein
MIEVEGSKGVFAVLSEDEGEWYFCVYKPDDRTVLSQVRLCETYEGHPIREEDARLMWSTDNTKCGVAVYGRMRAILEIKDGGSRHLQSANCEGSSITDPEWLSGFDDYLDLHVFIRARQRYWKEIVQEHEPTVEPMPEDQTPIQTNFISYTAGPDKTFAVFEDDGDCGYLYAYSSTEQAVLRPLHVYDRSEKLQILLSDVKALWAKGKKKCGVAIWGKIRGIIDIESGREARAWMENRETTGIEDKEWLDGFGESA